MTRTAGSRHHQSMFITRDVTVNLPFAQASARLANLISSGGLASVSHAAYQDGLEAHLRVGPLPGIPGANKLVRIRFLEPSYTAIWMRVGLRWEATGATSGLFPVLDADITLSAAGDQASRLELAGTYRPPLGRLGQRLDRAAISKVAAATIHALLERVAAALANPAAEGLPEGHPGRALRPLVDPETS